MVTKHHSTLRWVLLLLLGFVLVAAYFAYPWLRTRVTRIRRLGDWLQNPQAHPDWLVRAGTRCGNAPFSFPTDGYIGFVRGDIFRLGKAHQGIDIFAGSEPGITPVFAAYPGYLTRLAAWKSTVIIRIPQDPLHPGRQIWTYYTHMADRNGDSYISSAYPAGTSELFVEAGTLIGYQGDYSGDAGNPVGVHLHFSIVMDDGLGGIRNELEIKNTLDPSPYLGLPLNARDNPLGIVTCEAEQ